MLSSDLEVKCMDESRRPRRSRYIYNRKQQGIMLTALLLAFVLIFSLVSLILPDRETSEAEKRPLAQVPAFSWKALRSGEYFAGWGDYLADQFVGRDFWISLRLGYSRLMGRSESNGVLLCRDHYLMEKPAAPDEAAVKRSTDAISAFAGRHPDLKVFMTAAPTAAGIMKSKLPGHIPLRDQLEDIRNLEHSLSGIRFIDVSPALEAHSDEQLYYRTDHHWTTLGAYYAFEAMAEEMGIVPAADYDIYTVSSTFEGTLAARSGSHSARDRVQIFAPLPPVDCRVTYPEEGTTTATLYSREALDTKDHYTVFFGGNHPRVDIQTNAGTGKNLLIFKDSYANCLVPFLTACYDKIILIDPRYYYESADSLVSSEKITDVLFLYNINTFHEDTSLAGVLK